MQKHIIKKDDTRIFLYRPLYMVGPAQNNMDIIKGENKLPFQDIQDTRAEKRELYLPLMENTYIQFIQIQKYALEIK